MLVRAETPADIQQVRTINLAAFDTAAEADLVDALRRRASPLISLVAQADEGVVGHILFSPVTLDARPDLRLLGLAPMAVLPAQQRRGVGSALVRAGLARCRATDACAVVVLGHPRFYPRFGFRPASAFGVRSEYDVPDEAFMLLELAPDSLRGAGGLASYHPAFQDL